METKLNRFVQKMERRIYRSIQKKTNDINRNFIPVWHIPAVVLSITLMFGIPVGISNECLTPYIVESNVIETVACINYKSIYMEELEDRLPFTDDEIDLIALVTMAEAEGENIQGKRLVIDTILNRVESEDPYYPDNVKDVIYQKNQFSSMWNGRADKCYVTEEIRQLVIEEIKERTNYEVGYFTAGNYGKYGKPMFQVGNHYFSSLG